MSVAGVRAGAAARALMAAPAAEALARGAAGLWWGVDEGDDKATRIDRAIGARSEGRFGRGIIEGEAMARLALA